MTTALVLSGGGNLGVVQVGFIEALYARGVWPDLIVGTSVGALNGALLAADPAQQARQRLAQIWLGLRHGRLFHRNPIRIGRNVIGSRLSLYRNEFVRRLVDDHLPVARFEQTQVPLYVTATNLTRGARRVFDRGPLLPALLASTAVPGLFPPVEIDGGMVRRRRYRRRTRRRRRDRTRRGHGAGRGPRQPRRRLATARLARRPRSLPPDHGPAPIRRHAGPR